MRQVGVFAGQFQSLAQMIRIFIAVKAGSFGCDRKENPSWRFEIDRFKIISLLYSGDRPLQARGEPAVERRLCAQKMLCDALRLFCGAGCGRCFYNIKGICARVLGEEKPLCGVFGVTLLIAHKAQQIAGWTCIRNL